MIPEKLYIPTTTLNFNNIMSSESVSPASFYARRGFGYKRFEKVEPNNLDNRIILYDKYPNFDIDDKELENYPMVIEIEPKTLKEDIIKGQGGLFFAEETIYLNPFSTKIIFRNDSEKTSTISKAEPSIETKMVSVYENSFITIEKESNIKRFEWGKSNIEDSMNDFSKYISEDRRINKLKGLFYAYLIASNKSVSQDIVTLKKYTRNLQNTLSAIIRNPDNRATFQQEEQLKIIYSVINNELIGTYLSPVIKEKSEKYQCDFYSLLKQENLWDSWLRQNDFSKYQVMQFFAPSKDKDKALNFYIQNLENQVLSIEHSQKNSKCDISCLPKLEFKRIVSIPEQKDFLGKLFNEYLEEAFNSDEFIQSRYEFAKAGGKIFKDEYQEKWDGSSLQQYINALLKNLNEFSAFDLKASKNTTLESFAAFCQKGESDIDKLEDYLISNEIGDFRIAFSLWGIVFGFSNMPKTMTNDFFMTNDLDYITNVYKYIFNQLHGIELDGSLKQNHTKKQVNEKIEATTTKEAEQIFKTLPDNQEIRMKLKECNLKPEQLVSISEIYEKNRFVINEKFFTSVKKIKGIGDKTIEKIKVALGHEALKKFLSTPKEPSLFEDKKLILGKEFFNDSNTFIYLESLIPVKLKKVFKTDLDWFQSEYMKGVSSQYYAKAPRDNAAVIDSFDRYIGKRKYAEQLKIDSIIGKLKELYLG
ncbi:hypothetical protein SAMN00777080_5049 [Aquiflexum balticum DSM 16537]|uniref:Uncharacterized protein n=1 Tax=Aquiflexum balticum DSM 16537 TaxID=758820 RepID=A0A1W2HC14_9BACT|nr:hypothetical protein [Aquiflexum balticum]SMD46364.1 hypothetical protein SAMN00777080_5049 [Aquiflexum balticum DSM 16537]